MPWASRSSRSAQPSHTTDTTINRTDQQLQAVVAHELGHIKCEHGVWITAANALALGLYSIGGGLGRMLGDRIQGEKEKEPNGNGNTAPAPASRSQLTQTFPPPQPTTHRAAPGVAARRRVLL